MRTSYYGQGHGCIPSINELIGEDLDVIIRLDAIPSNGIVVGDLSRYVVQPLPSIRLTSLWELCLSYVVCASLCIYPSFAPRLYTFPAPVLLRSQWMISEGRQSKC